MLDAESTKKPSRGTKALLGDSGMKTRYTLSICQMVARNDRLAQCLVVMSPTAAVSWFLFRRSRGRDLWVLGHLSGTLSAKWSWLWL